MIGYTWFKFVLPTIIGSIAASFSLENPSQLFRGAFLRLSASDFLSSSLFDFSIRFDWLSLFPNRCLPLSLPRDPESIRATVPIPFGFFPRLLAQLTHPSAMWPLCISPSIFVLYYWRSSGIFHAIASQPATSQPTRPSLTALLHCASSRSSPFPSIHPLLGTLNGWLVCRQRQTVC